MRVLVTGAAGFIGHHVCRAFLDQGHQVLGLDTLDRAGNPLRLRENGCEAHPSFTFLVWDLRRPIPAALAGQLGDVEVILNLASDSHVDDSIREPAPLVANNVGLMITMLEYARGLSSLKAFWQVSTDEVYGPSGFGTDHPLPCSTLSIHRPSNPYAASKAAQENLAHAWRNTYGLPIGIVNSMNVFGERQSPEKFVPMAISLLKKGEVVPVHAQWMFFPAENDTRFVPGSRGWVYAEDFALALRLLVERIPTRELAGDQQKYHVVGEPLNNAEVVGRLARIMGVPVRFEFVDCLSVRPGHDFSYALDGSYMARVGWHPLYSLEYRLRQTVQWALNDDLEKWR